MKPAQNNKRSEQEWIGLIAKQKASGMSRESWCRENNINPNSMLSAQKRLDAKRIADMNVDVNDRMPSNNKQEPRESEKDKLKWIEVNTTSSSESTAGFNAASLVQNRNAVLGATPLLEGTNNSYAMSSGKLPRPVVLIRSNGIEIEADAEYPIEHLTTLIGGLMRC